MMIKRFHIYALCLLVLTTFVSTSPAPPVEGGDPLSSFYYMLDVPGKITGYFSEMTEIGSEHEISEIKVTNEIGQEIIMKVPARLKFSDITLKRGIIPNMDAWTWRKMIETGGITEARANGTITLYTADLTPLAVWNFDNAWPVKVIVNGSAGQLVEELTIVVEGYERVQ